MWYNPLLMLILIFSIPCKECSGTEDIHSSINLMGIPKIIYVPEFPHTLTEDDFIICHRYLAGDSDEHLIEIQVLDAQTKEVLVTKNFRQRLPLGKIQSVSVRLPHFQITRKSSLSIRTMIDGEEKHNYPVVVR